MLSDSDSNTYTSSNSNADSGTNANPGANSDSDTKPDSITIRRVYQYTGVECNYCLRHSRNKSNI